MNIAENTLGESRLIYWRGDVENMGKGKEAVPENQKPGDPLKEVQKQVGEMDPEEKRELAEKVGKKIERKYEGDKPAPPEDNKAFEKKWNEIKEARVKLSKEVNRSQNDTGKTYSEKRRKIISLYFEEMMQSEYRVMRTIARNYLTEEGKADQRQMALLLEEMEDPKKKKFLLSILRNIVRMDPGNEAAINLLKQIEKNKKNKDEAGFAKKALEEKGEDQAVIFWLLEKMKNLQSTKKKVPVQLLVAIIHIDPENESAIKLLVEGLQGKDLDENDRLDAVRTLANVGGKVLPLLEKMLKNEEKPALRSDAIVIMRLVVKERIKADPKEVSKIENIILNLATDADANVREAVAHYARHIVTRKYQVEEIKDDPLLEGEKLGHEVLASLLRDKEKRVRRTAALSLVYNLVQPKPEQLKATVPVIREMILDKKESVGTREFLIQIFAELDDPKKAIPVLVVLLNEPKVTKVARKALQRLLGAKEAAAKKMAAEKAAREAAAKKAAAEKAAREAAAKKMAAEKAAKEAAARAKEAAEKAKEAAERAKEAEVKIKGQLPEIKKLLTHVDEEVRWNAALLVGTIDPENEEALSVLIKSLKQEEQVQEARSVLVKMKEIAFPQLLKVLEDGKANTIAKMNAATIIGSMNVAFGRTKKNATVEDKEKAKKKAEEKMKESVPVLLKTLEDPDSGVRLAVAFTLIYLDQEIEEAAPVLAEEGLSHPKYEHRYRTVKTLDKLITSYKLKKVPEAAMKAMVQKVRAFVIDPRESYKFRISSALVLLWKMDSIVAIEALGFITEKKNLKENKPREEKPLTRKEALRIFRKYLKAEYKGKTTETKKEKKKR